MPKGPGLKSLGLHISVIYCKFWSCDDNIGLKLKKPTFVILGEQHMLKNKCRPKVCPEIRKYPFSIIFFYIHILVTTLNKHSKPCDCKANWTIYNVPFSNGGYLMPPKNTLSIYYLLE